MLSWLRQPFPFVESNTRRVIASFCISLFVFLFLFLFRPFGLDLLERARLLPITLAYGGVTLAVTLLTNVAAVLLLPSFYNERRWSVGREILSVVITISLIALGNLLLGRWQGFMDFGYLAIATSFLFTFMVGIFPVGALVAFRQITLLKKNLQAAAVMNTDIPSPMAEKSSALPESVLLTIKGDGKNETLTILPHHFIMAASADNYVEVFYLDRGKPARVLLRTTLQSVEKSLAGFDAFLRCHRGYIVNLEQVTHVDGNSQGVRLRMNHQAESIPVSRAVQPVLKEKLHALSNSSNPT